MSESFPARFRYSGAALAYNMGAPFADGVIPVVWAVILGICGKDAFLAWSHIVLVVLLYDLASEIAILLTKETMNGNISEDV
ncbi:hypothetical protein ACNF40_07125 [Cuniculiplasma sp. SKW4]|uniref:hypothetical protein n=1 Tax=Cuniculiplasma sp. SKW4 TaxID=3400171 RepID=UPI003FD0EBB0